MVKEKKLFILISLLAILVDQLLKYLVVLFSPDWNLGVLSINFITNTGAGFGILQGRIGTLTIISSIVVLGIILFYKKIPSEKLPQVWFALFLGGASSNLIDRLFRGYVIDFINFSFWPAFNVADVCISIATVGLVVYFWKK